MLEIKSDREPIDLSEVESVEAIMKRFATGGMSLGPQQHAAARSTLPSSPLSPLSS